MRAPVLFIHLFVAWSAILLLVGMPGVFQVSEAREGVVVNEILHSGEWVLPMRHGTVVPSKPPLFHWSSAMLAHGVIAKGTSLDSISPFLLRLPSVLSGFALIIIFCWSVLPAFRSATVNPSKAPKSPVASAIPSGNTLLVGGTPLGGTPLGGTPLAVVLWGASLLTGTFGFYRMTFDGRVDMVFAALMSAALLVWVRSVSIALSRGQNRIDAVSSVGRVDFSIIAGFFGLAVLAKGPLGAVMPIAVLIVTTLTFAGWRSWRSLLRREWMLTLLVCVPWYTAATIRGGLPFLKRQLLFENIDRFVGAEGITQKPFWFYVPQMFDHFAPWMPLFFALAAYALVRKAHRVELQKLVGFVSGRWQSVPALQFVWWASVTWFISGFVLLSMSSGKRAAYLLLVAVPVATLFSLSAWAVAQYQFEATESLAKLQRVSATWSKRLLLALWLILLVLLVFAWFNPISDSAVSLHKVSAYLNAISVAFRGWWWTYGGVLGSFSGLILWALHARRVGELLSAWGHFLCALVVVLPLSIKGISHGQQGMAAAVRATCLTDESWYFVKPVKQETYDVLFFELGRRVLLADTGSRPTVPGCYIAQRAWFETQPADWRASHPPLRTARRLADDESRDIVIFRLDALKAEPAMDKVNQEQKKETLEAPKGSVPR